MDEIFLKYLIKTTMRLTNSIKIILFLIIAVGILALSYYLGYERKKQVSLNLAHTQAPSPAPSTSKKEVTANIQHTPKPTIDPNFVCGTTTVKDIDNNIYNTVQIGSQCWMKENIKVTKSPEGNTITRYCYNNNPGNCDTDGGLYDWNTAMNGSEEEGAQGICPTGWHIPKDSEWYVLEKGLATEDCDANRYGFDCVGAGTKLLIGGSSGFEAIPVGYRLTDGSFLTLGEYTYLWSSMEGNRSARSKNFAWSRDLKSANLGIGREERYKTSGVSIRCLKD